jgi:hypothetical protein
MKVYMVSAGSYSDYHVVALYTDEEQANLHAERLDAVDDSAYAQVSEVETATHAPTFYPLWDVWVADNGVVEERAFHYTEEEPPAHADVEVWRSDYPAWDTGWHAQSTDRELAKKAALDRHYQEKAEKAGL